MIVFGKITLSFFALYKKNARKYLKMKVNHPSIYIPPSPTFLGRQPVTPSE